MVDVAFVPSRDTFLVLRSDLCIEFVKVRPLACLEMQPPPLYRLTSRHVNQGAIAVQYSPGTSCVMFHAFCPPLRDRPTLAAMWTPLLTI